MIRTDNSPIRGIVWPLGWWMTKGSTTHFRRSSPCGLKKSSFPTIRYFECQNTWKINTLDSPVQKLLQVHCDYSAIYWQEGPGPQKALHQQTLPVFLTEHPHYSVCYKAHYDNELPKFGMIEVRILMRALALNTPFFTLTKERGAFGPQGTSSW